MDSMGFGLEELLRTSFHLTVCSTHVELGAMQTNPASASHFLKAVAFSLGVITLLITFSSCSTPAKKCCSGHEKGGKTVKHLGHETGNGANVAGNGISADG